ncbi:MAG: hypothetical protein WC998_01820 [Candidatus Paceibacterota bacterium]|jgi:Fe2+ transport system protein B
MNKKQILLLSIFSALIISGFGFVSVMASSGTGTAGVLNKVQEIQKRLGITLTPEQQTQIDAKQKEMETKRADELTKWQSMTLDLWKQQEISKINSTTQEQFDKIKERNINMFKNGKGFMGRFDKGTEEPAD